MCLCFFNTNVKSITVKSYRIEIVILWMLLFFNHTVVFDNEAIELVDNENNKSIIVLKFVFRF